MNLQWYPGHMTKARRAMEENLKLVDALVEIRDARIPYSSTNPDLAALGKNKKRILVLNKGDLADPVCTDHWEKHFVAQDYLPLSGDARQRRLGDAIKSRLSEWAEEKRQRDKLKGIVNRPVRIMVVGIPNVGKSTLINTLAGRASSKTGNKPGVTRGVQWIRLSSSVELMDTPGILWPRFQSETVGLHLALCGSLKEEILDPRALALKGIELLHLRYPDALPNKYQIHYQGDPSAFLRELAIKQGLLLKGAEADLDGAGRRFLQDLQGGRLGLISLESPDDFGEQPHESV